MIENADKNSEEKLKPGSIEVMKYVPQDRTEVTDKDPNYSYYWESRRKLQENGGKPDRGYEVVYGNMRGGVAPGSRKEIDKTAPHGESGNFEGTERTLGDLVLTRNHKNFHESRKEHYRKINIELLNAARDVSKAEHFDSIRNKNISGRRVMIQGGITR